MRDTVSTFEPIYKRERAEWRIHSDDVVVVEDEGKLLTKKIKTDPKTRKTTVIQYDDSLLSRPHIIGWTDIYDLSRILTELEKYPHCGIIRGNPFELPYIWRTAIYKRYKFKKEPETNYYEAVKRRWVAIDTDKLPTPVRLQIHIDPRGVAAWIAGEIARYLPGMTGVTVHVQFTSSAGLHLVPGHPSYGAGGRELTSARIWVVLDKPYTNDELVRWCRAANAAWFAHLPKDPHGNLIKDAKGKAPKPLIDTSIIASAVQLNYTADPVLIDTVPFLAQRSFLIEGPLKFATPVIPTDAAIQTFERQHRLAASEVPRGIGYLATLNLIGDQTIPGKLGFQAPIFSATGAAVREHGADVDFDDVLDDVREQIALHRGPRDDADCERYGSESFVFAKLQWHLDAQRVAEAEAATRLLAVPRITFDARTLAEGQLELARVARHVIATCIAYRRLRLAYEAQEAIFCPAGANDVAKAALKTAIADAGDAGDAVAEAELAAIRKSERTARKAIRVKLMRQFGLKRWPKVPRFVINSTLGLGKTSQLQFALAAALNAMSPADRESFGSVDWYAPSYDLLDESMYKFDRMRCRMPHRSIRGRAADDFERRLEGLPLPYLEQFGWDEIGLQCPRAAAAAAMAQKGVGVGPNLCDGGKAKRPCPLRDLCGYHKQTEDERAHVNFLVHSNLTRARRKGLTHAAMLIIDENPAANLLKDVDLDISSLRSVERILDLFRYSLTVTPEDLQHVQWAAGGLREIIMNGAPMASLLVETAERALNVLIEDAAAPIATGLDEDADIIQTMDGLRRRDLYTLKQLLEQFLGCVKNGVELRDTIQVAFDKPFVTMSRYTPLQIGRHQPVIVLDATGDATQLSAILGGKVEFFDIIVPEHLHVTQIAGLNGSKSSLYGYPGTLPAYLITDEHVEARSAKLSTIVDKVAGRAAGLPGLVLTHRETEGYIADMLPDSLAVLHFGKMRGINRFEGRKFVAVLGRQLPALHDLERRRAAMAAVMGPRPLYPHVTAESYAVKNGIPNEDRVGGYFIHTVTGEIWHPDQITNAMLKEGSVNEIIQGVGRVRAVRSTTPVEVLILTDIVIPGLAPNNIIQWSEFAKAAKRTKMTNFISGELAGDFTEIKTVSFATEVMVRTDWYKNAKAAEKSKATLMDDGKLDVAKILVEIKLSGNFPITASTPPGLLLKGVTRADLNKEMRGGYCHYGKTFIQLAVGTYLTDGQSRESHFFSVVPLEQENVHAGILAQLRAKAQRIIAGLGFTLSTWNI